MNMITRLKKMISGNAEKTSPAAPIRSTSPGVRAAYVPALNVDACLKSDVGCIREKNEDSCLYLEPESVEARSDKGLLALVCDGMGGHKGGETASRMACETIAETYYRSRKRPDQAIIEAFKDANRAIWRTARAQPGFLGMGTTSTALIIHGGAAIVAQVGDSRLYLIRNDQIYLMSEDHSAVMEMVRRGAMSIEQARRHEDKNIILRALGTQPEVSVSVWETPFPVLDNDVFVLCSDGCYDLVSDEEIRDIAGSLPPFAAVPKLISVARDRGGFDNITAGVLKIRHPPVA